MKLKLLISTLLFILFFNLVKAEEVYKVVLESSYPPYTLLDKNGVNTGG